VIAALVARLLAGYGIAMPVGAVAAYLVALTAQTSLRTGVFCRARRRDRCYRERRDGTGAGRAASGAAQAYLGMWGVTTMNPLTVVYLTALVLSRQAAAAPGRPGQAVFVVAVFVASASWQLVLAGGGAFLGWVLTGSRGRLITSIASTILIGALALHLLIAAS
jgi:arginine exporter protein ArgO